MRVCQSLAASLFALALVGCSANTPQEATTAPAIGPADDQTMSIVTAAQAYIASLDTSQQTASLFAFNDSAQRTRWSNIPEPAFERRGVHWGDLNDLQRARLMDLLNVVLSAEGVRMVIGQMEADEYLRDHPQVGAPGDGDGDLGLRGVAPPPGAGKSGPLHGAGLYYTAFLGSPSVTAPWTLQFGGHHLAINATIVGPNVTLAPSLTGGQPVKFDTGGKSFDLVEREARRAQALFDSLTPELRARAIMGPDAIDLLLGPGHDGERLQGEGLVASLMTADQKAKLLSLIETRIGLLNANDTAAAMARIEADLDKTFFAWFGPSDPAGGSYFRVTGPTILLEFAPQDSRAGGPSNHLHNIYRDPTNDYGAAWAPIP